MQQGGTGPGSNPGMMMQQQNMMNVGGPQQMGNLPHQQMQMSNGAGGLMHRGGPTMIQQHMMGPGGQMQHGPSPGPGPGPPDGGLTPQQQAQLQARMQMDSMHHGQSPHHHPQQQQLGPGPGGLHGMQHMHHGGGMNPHEQQKVDNISRAKQLLPNMRESLQNLMKTAAQAVYINNMVDSGSKPVDIEPSRFDRSIEEFFSVCDQMEMHLRTSIECIAQGMSSQRYLPTPVTQTRMDGSITYHQYIATVKGQIAYAKEVHDVLAEAAQKMVE